MLESIAMDNGGGLSKDATSMGATSTNMNCGGDDTVAHALYDANDLLDSGGGTVSRGPVGDTLGMCGLGMLTGAIDMDSGGRGADSGGGGHFQRWSWRARRRQPGLHWS
jgi:hypothetical protein